jgi:hypothetical protein
LIVTHAAKNTLASASFNENRRRMAWSLLEKIIPDAGGAVPPSANS